MFKLTRYQFLGVLSGNFIEHFDTALFSMLSPFFAPLFFPEHDPYVALLLTLVIIPIGKLARPFGAIVFGFIGDSRGNKKALLYSLFGSACVCVCMMLCPTYHQVGALAPCLLIMARFSQSFFAAGEAMGGALLVMENVDDDEKKDAYSSLYGTSTIGGILLASGLVALLCFVGDISRHWRCLYAVGACTALAGVFLRTSVPDVMPNKKVSSFVEHVKMIPSTIMRYRYHFLIVAIVSGFSHASYSFSLVLMNGFIPLITEISREEMMLLNTFLLVLDFMLLPLFGFVALKFSREKVMMGACLCVSLLAIPAVMGLQGAGLMYVLVMRIIFMMIGVAFEAPFHAWMQSFVPKEYRFTIASLGYAFGSKILGAPTAVISLWLYTYTGRIESIAWYWALLGLMTAYCLHKVATKEKVLLHS